MSLPYIQTHEPLPYYVEKAKSDKDGNDIVLVNKIGYDSANEALQGLKIGDAKYSITPVLKSEYSSLNESITGLKIGNKSYNLVAAGKINGDQSEAIGLGSEATDFSSAISWHAAAKGHFSSAIGRVAMSYGYHSIALGNDARAMIDNEFTCDTPSVAMTHSLKSVDNVFFRGEDISSSYSSFSQYQNGHYLSWYLPAKADYSYANQGLSGISFGGVNYRLLPLGT